jgi:imidazole glycerol-phosphate synthase subunit HisH
MSAPAMSAVPITVVDYGIGNVYSVQHALEHCGADVVLTSDPAVIAAADRLVLPGVGAFADGMKGLRDRALVEPIKRFVATGRPLLGICLGMQMLGTVSEEFGEHQGLGIIPGRVVPVPTTTTGGQRLKIPHIGWTVLQQPATGAAWPGNWPGTVLDDTPAGTAVYLVHSYHLLPDDKSHLLADCGYGGHRVTASVRSGNVFGCQFHPEKSGPAGLAMLAAFLRL